MVDKGKLLVVVCVHEGRKFPKRLHHILLVEAKFDGELLDTDGVEHTETPDFAQELAWELDKKALQQHRLQRTSIKVQVFAVDTQSSSKEAIGYVVMDLRSAQNTQTSKWYSLLNAKYQRCKPEIRLGIFIDDTSKQPPQGFKAKEAPARPVNYQEEEEKVPVEMVEGFNPASLKPVLHDVEGFYQIGPANKCKEQFVLSVTIAFATNLPQLIPTNIALPASGFFFYYTLFGNDVTNEPFQDLLNPNFPAERASVKIRSSVEALRQFLSSQPGIEFHLCCGNQSLGSAEIGLVDLLKKGSTEIFMKPITIEGAFQLHPPNRLRQKMGPVPEDNTPVVGVSIVLRKEDQAMIGTPIKDPPPQPATTASHSPKASPTRASPKQQRSPGQKSKPAKKEKKKPPTPPPSPPTPHEGSYSETFDSASHSSHVQDRDQPGNEKASTEKLVKDAASIPQVEPAVAGPSVAPMNAIVMDSKAEDTVSSSTQQHVVVPHQANHFSFSIDLRSVRNLTNPHQANVFLRYTYPFFGSAAPILTQPPVEVRRVGEVLLPQGYCAFDFATVPQQLQETLSRVPLIVEMWDREKDKAQNNFLGAAQILLSRVLGSEKARATGGSGETAWRQVWSDWVPVFNAESGGDRVAEVQVILSLEDWGSITRHVTVGGSPQQSHQESNPNLLNQKPGKSHAQFGHPDPSPAAPAPTPAPAQVDARETAEYQAALELEMWKEQQETMFEKQLHDKEAAYMKALVEEWKKRDKERELMVQKKMTESTKLEDQLRRTLIEVEKRERLVQSKEQEVNLLRTEVQREHERKMTEIREASRRMKEDCDHQVELEKGKVREMEEYVSRLKSQLSEADSKYHQLDKEFSIYREQQNSKPEVRLQAEINMLTMEKAELEHKVEQVTRAKVQYKQQWGRALKELARLKQQQQQVARAHLQKQQTELEDMRLRYLAAEEKEVVKSERKELEGIKNELNLLRDADTNRPDAKPQPSGVSPFGTYDPDISGGGEDHISRLIEERDTLLKTGVYTSSDRIISELDRQINEAISNRGSELGKKELIRNLRELASHTTKFS